MKLAAQVDHGLFYNFAFDDRTIGWSLGPRLASKVTASASSTLIWSTLRRCNSNIFQYFWVQKTVAGSPSPALSNCVKLHAPHVLNQRENASKVSLSRSLKQSAIDRQVDRQTIDAGERRITQTKCSKNNFSAFGSQKWKTECYGS